MTPAITTLEELIAFTEPVLAEIFAAVTAINRAEQEKANFNPNQPRIPTGKPTAGQWTIDLGEIAKKYGWSDAETLKDHMRDHGKDFNARSARDYAKQAKSFYERGFKEKLPMVQDRSGNIRIYDPKTNSFGAYNKDGSVRTFYKPTDGIKYYEQQVKRYGTGRGRVIHPLAEKPPTTRIGGGRGGSGGANTAPPLNPRLITKPFTNN